LQYSTNGLAYSVILFDQKKFEIGQVALFTQLSLFLVLLSHINLQDSSNGLAQAWARWLNGTSEFQKIPFINRFWD
jgi:hypothetical protein